uniref:Putative secreted protein n=1 Tax=Ixodes ricinus TaxID=34613 RepID=A0A6B0U9C1_IXORI
MVLFIFSFLGSVPPGGTGSRNGRVAAAFPSASPPCPCPSATCRSRFARADVAHCFPAWRLRAARCRLCGLRQVMAEAVTHVVPFRWC